MDAEYGEVSLGPWLAERRFKARNGNRRDLDLMPLLADALRIDRKEWDAIWNPQKDINELQPNYIDYEAWLVILRRWKNDNVCDLSPLVVCLV